MNAIVTRNNLSPIEFRPRQQDEIVNLHAQLGLTTRDLSLMFAIDEVQIRQWIEDARMKPS